MPTIALLAILEGLKALPYIVAGIQAIHGDAIAGADKKTLALESLGLATAAADATLPPDQKAMADTASAVASSLIDSIVGAFKLGGIFGFHSSTPKVAIPVKA